MNNRNTLNSRYRPANRPAIGIVAIALLLIHMQTTFGQELQVARIGDTNWLSFPECTAYVENSVEVPALESGVLMALSVKKNDTVEVKTQIAQLDSQLSKMDIRLARLQHDAAQQQAEDNSRIDYQEAVLQVAREELASLKNIRSSVSDSELRRATLSVRQAEQAIVRESQAQAHAKVDAQLKSAAVDAAQMRLERRTVRAPISGVVSTIHVQPGQWAETGKPIVTIDDMSRLIVDAMVPVAGFDLRKFAGAPVRADVKTSEGPLRLSGRVLSYDHQVSRQGLIRVHTEILNLQNNGSWVLLPGMTVTLHLAQKADESLPMGTPVNSAPPAKNVN